MLSLAMVDHWEDTKRQACVFLVTASGNYTNGTGDAVPLATFNNPTIKSGSSPTWIDINSLSGYGFSFAYTAGAQPMAAILHVYSGLIELPTGAYPAIIANNPFYMKAIFLKHI